MVIAYSQRWVFASWMFVCMEYIRKKMETALEDKVTWTPKTSSLLRACVFLRATVCKLVDKLNGLGRNCGRNSWPIIRQDARWFEFLTETCLLVCLLGFFPWKTTPTRFLLWEECSGWGLVTSPRPTGHWPGKYSLVACLPFCCLIRHLSHVAKVKFFVLVQSERRNAVHLCVGVFTENIQAKQRICWCDICH